MTRLISNIRASILVPALTFSVICIYRVSLCLQPPTETSDLYRNLGYSAQLFTRGFDIYKSVAGEFSTQLWAQFWPMDSFIYPPAILCFFSVFAGAGLGLFWVKLTFTIVDLISSWLISREFGLAAGLITFAAPISLWFTSHEGQFESLVCLCLILGATFVRHERWGWAGFILLIGFQIKFFTVLLAPWLIYQYALLPREKRERAFAHFLLGAGLAIIPFVGFYIASPDIFLRPFFNQTKSYNPFYANFFNTKQFTWQPMWLNVWDSGSTYLEIFLLAIFMFGRPRRERVAQASPFMVFLILLKSLHWGQFWYTAVTPGFVNILRQSRKWVFIFLVVYFIHEGRSLSQLVGMRFGVGEQIDTIMRFDACKFRCNYSAPVWHMPIEMLKTMPQEPAD
jgi:hypothetical protein